MGEKSYLLFINDDPNSGMPWLNKFQTPGIGNRGLNQKPESRNMPPQIQILKSKSRFLHHFMLLNQIKKVFLVGVADGNKDFPDFDLFTLYEFNFIDCHEK